MRKSKVLVVMGMCFVTLFFNGCGSGENNMPVVPEAELIVNMDETEKVDVVNEEKQDEEKEKSDEVPISDTLNQESPTQESESVTKESNTISDLPVSASEQRSGVIEKVNTQDFIINLAYVDNFQDEKFGEIDMMEFSPVEEKKELISINYSDATVFVVQTIKDGGNEVTQREGTASDLEVGRIVTIDGTDSDGSFLAVKVVINIVI